MTARLSNRRTPGVVSTAGLEAADAALTARVVLLEGAVFNVKSTTYGAVGDDTTDDTTAIQAAITACGAAGGGVVYIPRGTYKISSPLTLAADNIRLVGAGRGVSILRYVGTTGTACVTDDAGAVRRTCGLHDLTVKCTTSGAIALRLQNSYRWASYRCSFESANGTTGIAVEGAGSTSRSCYFNTFHDCDASASLAAVKLNDNINGWRFIGGVFDGAGYAVWMPGTTSTSGTNEFVAVGMQSEGTNTSGVIIQLGTTGAQSFQASYNTFAGCRIETSATTTIVNENNAFYNAFVAGSISGTVTVVDNTTGANVRAGPIRLVHGGPPLVVPNAAVVGRGATSARPSAVTVGVGAQFFDTTYGKSIFSDGTVWRDTVDARVFQTGLYYTADGGQGDTTSLAVVNNTDLSRFSVGRTTAFDRITIEVTVGVATSVVRLGVYTDVNDKPGTLVFDAGTVDASSNGVKEITIAQTLLPGRYWLAAVAQVVACTWRSRVTAPNMGQSSGGNANITGWRDTSTVSGALPSTLPTLGLVQVAIPKVMLRAV